ncbi:hypothetical protein J437_LFUL003675 [Ladona fulva]|uniref:Uncharacterized protein n=1 Tax=Ladona fulva TaxID=123851 RepID=A0A8K0NVQ2_LADFU|nr:hypothetical protein J437_LFUL003675 [Ladona fulva]
MPKHVPPEDLLIPPQDNRICGTICVCQMTAVLSSVALVYLSVAVYMPSMRAFKSGFDETPVMCTTTRAVLRGADNCEWGSCGEWCLSKSGGGGGGTCWQIFVTLRRNGSHLLFQNCTNAATKTCFGIDTESARKMRCIADECRNLTGTFNCTEGMCINITDAFECVFLRRPQPAALPSPGTEIEGGGGTAMSPLAFPDEEPPSKCSGRRGKITCIALDGLQQCVRGTCVKIRPPYNCDRRCVDIPTRNKNVILLSGDKVYLSRCTTAVLAHPEPKEEEEEGEEEKEEKEESEEKEEDDEEEPEEPRHGPVVWRSSTNPDDILLVSCHTVINTTRGVEATDCINGSLLERSRLADLTNFTHLTYLSAFYERALDEGDETGRIPIAPAEARLIIANESRLLINLEGCVNTLRDECKEFIKEYGRDGTDHNARARFPCFFSPGEAESEAAEGSDFSTTAVARFDLAATYREFLVAALLPSVLFVLSCFTLLLCQRTVAVGDDARMRFTGCANLISGTKNSTGEEPPPEVVNTGGEAKCSPGESVAVDMADSGAKSKTVEEEEEDEEEDRANGDGGGGGTGRPF